MWDYIKWMLKQPWCYVAVGMGWLFLVLLIDLGYRVVKYILEHVRI
jgi:hypothetical protein